MALRKKLIKMLVRLHKIQRKAWKYVSISEGRDSFLIPKEEGRKKTPPSDTSAPTGVQLVYQRELFFGSVPETDKFI